MLSYITAVVTTASISSWFDRSSAYTKDTSSPAGGEQPPSCKCCRHGLPDRVLKELWARERSSSSSPSG